MTLLVETPSGGRRREEIRLPPGAKIEFRKRERPHPNAPTVTLEDRTIREGEDVMEVTEQEVRMRAVRYLYLPAGTAASMEARFVAPEAVLQAINPEVMFQVSPDGYEGMRGRAKRIIALWNGERFGDTSEKAT